MKLEHSRELRGLVGSFVAIALLATPPAFGQQDEEGVQVALAPSAAPAPQQPMPWNQVRIIRVKGDRVADFEARLKELSAALSRRDDRGLMVWQVAFGEQNTYHLVSQLQSFASLTELEANPPMEQAQWASWLERMRSTVDSLDVGVAQVHADLSMIPQFAQSGANPELMILVTDTLLPGKRNEFMALLRNELIPAFRKSPIIGLVTNEMTFGIGTNNWVFAVPIQNWAELDKPMPLIESMGQQAAEALLARADAMVASSETLVLRARPDLSTTPQQAQGQGVQR